MSSRRAEQKERNREKRERREMLADSLAEGQRLLAMPRGGRQVFLRERARKEEAGIDYPKPEGWAP